MYERLPVLMSFFVLVTPAPAWAQQPGGTGARPAEPAPVQPQPASSVGPQAPPVPPPTRPGSSPPAETKPEESEPRVVDVRVTGVKPKQTSGSVHVLGQKQLQRFRYDDPHQVLLSVPGVYVRQEDGFGLRPNIGMRGASSDRSKKLTLMEDGVLFGPAPYSAPAAYYFPLMMRMRAVRVTKGPASIVHGPHTVGGAIDLLTMEIPSTRKGTVDMAFGQYGFNKTHLTYGSSDESSGFLIEGLRLGTSGFKTLDGDPGADTGFSRNEWMAKAHYVVDPTARVQNQLAIKLGYSDEVSNETYLGLTDADFRASPYRRYGASRWDRMEWHRTQASLTHRVTFSRDLEMVTTVYRHDLERAWRKVNGFRGADISDVLTSPGSSRNAVFYNVLAGRADASSSAETLMIGPNDRRFVSQGVQTHVRYNTRTGPLSHKIEYGTRAHYDEIVRQHTQDGFVTTGPHLVPDGRPTEQTADNIGSTHALSMYATDAITWDRLTLTPGVRVEVLASQYKDHLTGLSVGGPQRALIPGMGAYYAITRDLGMLAGVHRGFSPAPPGEARAPRPEQSVNFEAGARHAGRSLRAELIGFYNAYSNLTSICSFANGCVDANLDRQFDGGKARVYGLEAFGEAEIKVGRGLVLPVRGAYTFTQSEFLSSFESADPLFGRVRQGDMLPYVPVHQGSAAVGIENAKAGFNVGGSYVGEMRERASQGEVAPGELTDSYFLLDASGQYKLTRWLTLYVNARNLLDTAYIVARRPYGARPGAPRWVQAGAKVEF